MVLGGVSWQFIVSNRGSTPFDDLCLREDGTMLLQVITNDQYIPARRFIEARNALQ